MTNTDLPFERAVAVSPRLAARPLKPAIGPHSQEKHSARMMPVPLHSFTNGGIKLCRHAKNRHFIDLLAKVVDDLKAELARALMARSAKVLQLRSQHRRLAGRSGLLDVPGTHHPRLPAL